MKDMFEFLKKLFGKKTEPATEKESGEKQSIEPEEKTSEGNKKEELSSLRSQLE